MDIICRKCGEPWDFGALHEVAEQRYEERFGVTHGEEFHENREQATRRYEQVFTQVSRDWRALGCVTITNEECETRDNNATAIAEAAYEVCGDDLDGAAALMEDMGA